MTSPTRLLPRAAAVSLAAAFAVLLFAGPAAADPTDPPAPTDSSAAPTDPSVAPTTSEPAPTDPGDSIVKSDATDPGDPDRTERVKAPGKITCEDLDLGATLQKVNGARKNKVIAGDGVSSVVRDTDVDHDGDPDSLFVTVEEGTAVTAVVAIHGNRANIYESAFGAGEHGPFYAPPRKKNAQPPVTHRLICGPLEASPAPSETSSETPSEAPSETETPSAVPSSPAPGDGGGLPVTGLALTGLVLAGVGMVGAGVAMRALRRKNEDTPGETEDGDAPTDV